MDDRKRQRSRWGAGATREFLLVIGSLVALTPAPGFAAAPGTVRSVTVDPGGDVLFAAAESGLYRSRDGGRTLTPVALPGSQGSKLTAVVLDWAAGGVLYVATEGAGVLRSRDGGQTWTGANKGLESLRVVGLALDPRARQKLHAMTPDKGLFRTADGGESWERVDDGPKGTMHVLASVNISTGMGGIFLYAGTDQGLVRGPD